MANSSLKSTLAVSLNNYLDAGAIVAGASGITLWKNYLELSEMHLGWINALSANALGAAIGAIIGGFLADKFGRKFIFTYNLLVYMLGVLIIMLSVNFPMLLAGFLITGISVGVGVPASWTYISESSEVHNRGRNICISQMSWGVGPMVILLFGMLFAPGGYLFDAVQHIASLFTDTTGYDAVASAMNALQDADIDTSKLKGANDVMQAMTSLGLSFDASSFTQAYNAYVSTNVFSSRVVFFTLFVVAFIAWNLQRGLQESAEFETAKNTKRSGIIANIRLLFTNRIAVKTAAFLAVIYLTWNLVASVLGFFLPHICETVGGLSNEQANWIASTQWMATVIITLGISLLIDRISHKLIYVLGLIIAISAWILIVTADASSSAILWTFAILWGIQSGLSVQIFYALWGSELFPAKFRAGAQGLMFFIVRGLSALGGLTFTHVYGEKGEGFTVIAWCMVALLTISLIVGFIGAPNTRGKSLEQITRERYGE